MHAESAEAPEKSTRILEEYLDKLVFILLHDNTTVEGILRSFDHFYNLLLEDAREATIAGDEYCLVESEALLLRGENIVLLSAGSLVTEGMKKTEYSKMQEKVKAASDDLDFITL
ncbi:U6 snRNA-associated Sm-like protein LSm1 [Nematocida major]|uniref:U6 snRNA-associated Sm-like protein LSm1 n=1 Tax=Nematocida major TaxID=1912982 RepID=UPI0020089505|nr:U6 snRNA-associated Sm-like protein LSm1 [Nematocida major]KAH9387361.1 U6 snRNA-associated Sm-like protein LSm1 [Nematocida major]